MRLSSPSGRGLRLLSNVLLVVLGVVFALPLLWVVLASVDAHATLAVALPQEFTGDNFAKVLTPELAFTPLLNSLLISLGTAVICVVVAVLAAYPLSRYRARYNKPFLYIVLFGSSLPITAIMVPVYELFSSWNLVDSIPATVLFMATAALPLAIWMCKNFIDGVPISLEEAAWVDGASSMRALVSIVIPLVRPGIGVVFLVAFVQAWGNFFVPFILLLSPEHYPAAISIFAFFGEHGTVAYGQLAAYSLIYAAPVLALYVFISRALGGTAALAGAVKG
jgi:multiple sugar transport system permease protein